MKLSRMFIMVVIIHSVHLSKLRITEQGKKACSSSVAIWGVVRAVRWDKKPKTC